MDDASGASVWAGRAVSALVVLFLVGDAAVSLVAPHTLDAELAATGFPFAMVRPLGFIMLACALLYMTPWMSVLGAILVTGFCGGAIATHFRLGEFGSPPQIICFALGALTWLGLYLRDPRLRALLPITT